MAATFRISSLSVPASGVDKVVQPAGILLGLQNVVEDDFQRPGTQRIADAFPDSSDERNQQSRPE